MWRQKGQDMIEYALMLALVVGIGGFIYTQGYGTTFPPFSTTQAVCWSR